MSYAERLAVLAAEGAAQIDTARARLQEVRGEAAAWIPSVDALLAMVGEVVAGARSLAPGESACADDGPAGELGEALGELREAVLHLADQIADLADPGDG